MFAMLEMGNFDADASFNRKRGYKTRALYGRPSSSWIRSKIKYNKSYPNNCKSHKDWTEKRKDWRIISNRSGRKEEIRYIFMSK